MTDTTDLVARLEGLLEKASPPPWTSRVVPITYPECDDADLPAVVFNADGKEVTCLPERYWGPSNQHEDDAALIAEAITALPALLAAVREGEAEIERLTDERDDYRERLHDVVMVDGEEWAIGGGPGFKERHDKAWSRAREPFEP